MRRLIGRFLRNESGATAIEYGLICALIFLAIVTSVSALANTQNGGLAVTVERLTTAMKAVVGN
ncbi:Flp family type IVb pilin [alpha proteobacterium L41A]|uniref:Flp family type IVb pilin n=1 Tax=Brevundimonas vesicularis TaxID=41276 RepID=UPI00037CABB7